MIYIHCTTISLQERNLPLAKCRVFQEELIDEVNDNKQDSESHWYKALFGKVYIPYTSNKRPDKNFVNAVCKV